MSARYFAVPILLVVLGLVEMFHPFGPAFISRMPVVWILAGALLAARHGARMSAQNRKRILDAVPEKPLGLSDDG